MLLTKSSVILVYSKNFPISRSHLTTFIFSVATHIFIQEAIIMYLYEITILKFANITCNNCERPIINDTIVDLHAHNFATRGKNIERWIEHGWNLIEVELNNEKKKISVVDNFHFVRSGKFRVL